MNMSLVITLILIGVFAGMLGGLVGVGGGIIIVPALIYFASMSQHEAQGTSLGVIIMPVGIFAVWNYYQKGFVNFKYAAIIAVGFLVGGYLGSKISLSISQDVLKKIFATLMIVIAVKILWTGK